jgi:ELWxxDGT repeat protein
MYSEARLGGLVIFSTFGDSLVVSDGTVAGTRGLAGTPDGYPLVTAGRYAYYGDGEPFRTDGSVVEQLADVRPGPDPSTPYPLAEAGPAVLFAADDGVHGMEVWGIDRSTTTAELFADIEPGADDGLAREPGYAFFGRFPGAGAGGRGFFLAGDAATGEELWSSDGTPGGTGPLRDVFPGPRSSEVRWLTAAGDRVFFVADDGVHGREPWTSDGTRVGTRLLADLVPGPGSSLPAELTAVADRVYFAAHTPGHGRELWVADGTPGGTRRLTDLAPGPLPSSPMALTVSGGWLWFVATDGVTGFEPYRLGLPGTIFADSFESGDTGAWSASR